MSNLRKYLRSKRAYNESENMSDVNVLEREKNGDTYFQITIGSNVVNLVQREDNGPIFMDGEISNLQYISGPKLSATALLGVIIELSRAGKI